MAPGPLSASISLKMSQDKKAACPRRYQSRTHSRCPHTATHTAIREAPAVGPKGPSPYICPHLGWIQADKTGPLHSARTRPAGAG